MTKFQFRPYLSKSIEELERLVEASRHDVPVLRRISAELTNRATDRAQQLQAKVTAILDGQELPLPTQPIVAKTSPEVVRPVPSKAPPVQAEPVEGRAKVPNIDGPADSSPVPPNSSKPTAPLIFANPSASAASLPRPAFPQGKPKAAPAGAQDPPRPMLDRDIQPVANPLVLDRMTDLIDYVIAVEKNKQKTVTDYAEHRGFHRRHDELSGLPGVAFNRLFGEDSAWLTVERLNRRLPPDTTDPVLKPWLVLVDDTARKPSLRDTLRATECQQAGIRLAPSQTSISLVDFSEADAVRAALEDYTSGPWATWAATEAPRRRSMALYNELFALRQTLISPDDVPQELVCGLGYAALLRDGKRLHYPLLTVPLDIELDPLSHVIALVPRAEGRPIVEADAPDAMDLEGVNSWRAGAKAFIEALEDDPLSPFVPSTFEPILRNAAALFDPGATYAGGVPGEPLPIPPPGKDLRITDGFGFLQRKRSANQLMLDLEAFRDRLVASEGRIEIPAAVATLFTDPSESVAAEDFPTFRGINSIAGVTSSDGTGTDLFFPKPFNAEQVQIAQRLAVRDGVVVQGPPGTGKTHTIANIISHYLATGRRVLVTSQKSPALKVLQSQLPAPLRPLAVSLLDSDREGLQQFRGSVELIAGKLMSLRKTELDSEITGLETAIDGLHRKLAAIDREIDQIGRAALSKLEIDGQQLEPLDAAREVLAAGSDATWLPDEIGPEPRFDATFSEADIGALRTARQLVGEDITYFDKTLPPVDLLAHGDRILEAHEQLQQAATIEGCIAAGEIWPLIDRNPDTLATVNAVREEVVAWNQRRLEFAQSATPLDPELARLLLRTGDPVAVALRQLRPEAANLAESHRFFLTRPVELPVGHREDPKFGEALANLAEGGSGLGPLSRLFARTTKAHLAAVRIRGSAPSDTADWQVVSLYVDAVDRALAFVSSWNHVVDSTALPAIEKRTPAAGQAALDVLDRLDELAAIQNSATVLSTKVRQLLPSWQGRIDWQTNPADILECLRVHVSLSELRGARSVRDQLLAALIDEDTDLNHRLRALAVRIGEPDVSRAALAAELAGCAARLKQLHGLEVHLDKIDEVCRLIETCGAPSWAEKLEVEPAGATDIWCPANWRTLWRLRRLDRWLAASDQSAQLRALHSKREEVERDLSRAYERCIEQRTWRALKQKASPQVMTALSAYAVAVGKIGRGTGKSANRHRKAARSAAEAVKGALPCWIMPHHRVSESLPAEFGIFDLVIVDEASQSTLSALPAVFRSRQILVVGDDKQVSPDNVGLDMAEANKLVARHLGRQVKLFVDPMRQESSLYDLASVIFGADRFMLREHFRCAGAIIEFSKRQFYNNDLRPLRISKASERLDPVLVDVLVTDGYRKGKINPPEADFILEELRRIGRDSSFDNRSIGVTTLLGTEQAAFIEQRVRNELGIPFMEKYRVHVGDPVVFQGDERDIMFLSMVAAPGEATALSGLAYEQRFNVAASRARERMILVRSIDVEQLSPADKLRRALLEHFRSPFPLDAEQAAEARLRCESDFERELFDELSDRGYVVDTQVRAGQYRIDMVVEGDEDRRLAIECDGDRYHGPEQWPADMQRQRTLERAGWRFWRCFASRFVRERTAVLNELCAVLEASGISPRSTESRSMIYTELRTWCSREAESIN